MKKLPTIAMTPMPEFGYDPIPLILSGEKVHTLRKHRCYGQKEITWGGTRMGIIVEFHDWVEMTRGKFLTDEFAYADGFREMSWQPPWILLEALLKHFYGEVPETMWCNHFCVVQRPEEEPK